MLILCNYSDGVIGIAGSLSLVSESLLRRPKAVRGGRSAPNMMSSRLAIATGRNARKGR